MMYLFAASPWNSTTVPEFAGASLVPGSLRLDNAGNVLVDLRANPGDAAPRRTLRWDAMIEGRIGVPVEVK